MEVNQGYKPVYEVRSLEKNSDLLGLSQLLLFGGVLASGGIASEDLLGLLPEVVPQPLLHIHK